MKTVITYMLMVLPALVLAQPTTLVDNRDNRSYDIGEVNGQIWMLENLQLETSLSLGFSPEQQKKYPTIRARWYHMDELASVCPAGWRLPTANDWIGYIQFLVGTTDAKLRIQSGKDQISLDKFSKYFSLFEEGNPLRIIGAGIFQGSEFYHAPISADYWIEDLPTRESQPEHSMVKNVRVSYPKTSHIHLFDKHTNIHSHEHHLDPQDEGTLRRFMVRCILIDE